MNPLTPIEDVLRWVVLRLHDQLGMSVGWSIVVLVLLVRFALVPLMVKQYRSMRRMQVMAPQLKELQAKYKGDRAKQQEEMMRFYQENNINPFASCAPMLVQMPIFFALYYVLRDLSRHVPDSVDQSFMGVIPDITQNISELGWASSIIIGLIYGGSQLLSSELSFEPHTPEMQRRMMRALPAVIVIGAFQFAFPAGLAIYWVTSNLFTAAQQLFIRHRIVHEMEENPEEFAVSDKRSSRAPKAEAETAEVVEASAGGETDAEPAAKPQTGRPRRTPKPRPVEVSDAEGAPDEAADEASEGGVPENAVARAKATPRKRGGGPPSRGRPGQRRAPKKRR